MRLRRWSPAALVALTLLAASLATTLGTEGQAAPLAETISAIPIVVNTWAGPCFSAATATAWETLAEGGSALDAVEKGCSRAEDLRCDRTVGYGGSPDEDGETTLDALVMDGDRMRAGAVADLGRCKAATAAARLVMERTRHTLLAGDQATQFAADMGLPLGSLSTEESREVQRKWVDGRCQPNFRRHVSPDPAQSCGPYHTLPRQPLPLQQRPEEHQGQERPLVQRQGQQQQQPWPSQHGGHDTIAMVAVDAAGSVAAGASSNGAIHKVPGRVGDAAVPGGGAYADSEVGGCGATGDGDIHLAFLPCYQVVESMRRGLSPTAAAEDAVRRIAHRVPGFVGAVVAVSKDGRHGGAAHGWRFQYSVACGGGAVATVTVEPLRVGPASAAAASQE